MEIIKKKITELHGAKYNPRKDLKPTDTEYQKLKRSIEEFGYVEPVIWNKRTNTVVGGHQRLKVLAELGEKEIDCVVVDIDSNKEKALNIALNKISGEWDEIKLEEVFKDLDEQEFDLTLTGFDNEEFEQFLKGEENEITEDDFDEEPPEEPITKYGDIIILGKHRLMCGDSTKAEDVEKLMGGQKAVLSFNDSPYGMKKEADGVMNDNQNLDELLAFNKKWIPLSFNALTSNGSWYCWGIDEPLMDIYSNILKPMIKESKITFRNLITWDKGDAGAGGVSFLGKDGLRSYPIADEKCLFVMCGVQGFNNNADNFFDGWEPIRSYLENEAKKIGLTAKKVQEICGVGMYCHWFTKSQFMLIPEKYYKKLQEYAKGEAFKKDYEEIKKDYYATRAYFDNTHDKMTNVWHFKRTRGAEKAETGGHATPKPLDLCARAIKSSSRQGDLVFDLFGGSGSTLIACEQLDRICYMMELSPQYCDVIVKRWEKLTGEKAIRL